MKRILVVVALITAAAVWIPGSGHAVETASGGCNEPVPERTYTQDQLVYGLAVDLTHCDWWDGSPIQLDAGLERLDGSGGHGAGSATVCGVDLTIRPDDGEESATETTAKANSGICDVQVAIEHPPAEAAYYRGEVSLSVRDPRVNQGSCGWEGRSLGWSTRLTRSRGQGGAPGAQRGRTTLRSARITASW